jgi:hypothetical protein
MTTLAFAKSFSNFARSVSTSIAQPGKSTSNRARHANHCVGMVPSMSDCPLQPRPKKGDHTMTELRKAIMALKSLIL